MPAPPAPRDWRFESRLPWPGVRGRRLWQHVTTGASASEASGDPHGSDANDDDDDDDANGADDEDVDAGLRRRRASLAVPSAVRYEVEMCESTAGHVALVLLRRDASASASPASTPVDDTTAAAAQLAIPRVLYVVDAVPPKRASAAPAPVAHARSSLALKRHSHVEPRWTMLAADARARSFGGATSAASAEGVATPSLVFSSVPPQQQHVDELALVEELFTTSRATKDACILAKPPLLCARFDCRLIAVRFSRAERSSSASTAASGSTSPLRCIVAREDGMCYIWEWSADLHTWSFLNRFCFLDNPNLKWTRPVVLFSTAHCPAWNSGSPSDAVETTELAWWSAETKDEPRLFVRKIQFGVEKNTFRTEIRIGSAFHVPRARDVAALHSSLLGLWVVSRTDGVRLRSVATLRVLQLSWAAVWGKDANDDASGSAWSATPLTCAHGVTGELLALHGGSGRVAVVSVRKQQDGEHTLTRRHLLTIETDGGRDVVKGIAAHRQLLLVLRQRVDVYSVVSGVPLVSLALPGTDSLALWTTASSGSRLGASAVGLVGARGYWQLRTPSGHALTALHAHADALRVARPYGETLAFDAARVALELLQSARALVDGPARQAAWDAAVQRLSSPALLLAALQTETSKQQQQQLGLLDDMAELVASIYRVTHEVLVTGRFGAAVDKRDDARLLRGLPFVTPANVEALHHLANWVLLAKRKLARLQSAVVHKGPRHARARTVSSLSTFTEDDDGTVDDDVLEDPADALPALHVDIHHHAQTHDGQDDSAAADDEASSSRLSRQLRPMTSLQFAAGSCSTRHGAQWLAQLEALLLPPAAPPHALLFHGERALADFQVALSSFSKHLYFESMARLYLLHAPHKLLAFVRTVAQFAPRLFTLRAGAQPVARSHAERALALLPPAHKLVARVNRETASGARPTTARSLSAANKHPRRKRSSSGGAETGAIADRCDAKTTLLVYAELLALCGRTLEACRVLLDADLYDDCVEALLLRPATRTSDDRDVDTDRIREEPEAVRTAVFFALLDHCVAHRGAEELEALLAQKPPHVDALLVLRALRQLLPRQMVRASSDRDVVSVGALRKVLLRLVREHGASQRACHEQKTQALS